MSGHIIMAAWNNRVVLLPLLFCTFAPVAALAQPVVASLPTANPPTESVTVTAPDAKPTPFLTGGSRWRFPLCPVTLGLVQNDNKRVSERVRQVAQLVGAPVQTRDDCKTNAEIVFTAEPQAFLDAVADKRYRLLGATPNQAKEAAKVRFPIQSWFTTAVMDEMGSLLLMPPDDDECDPYCFFRMGNDKGPPRIVIGTVIIVVDISKAQGHKLDALSDYVALMALTQARAFAKCQPAPSIANLLASDCAGVMQPDGLTAGDIAWLRALYHMSPERARRADVEDLAAQTAAFDSEGK